jgi:hypothetical protein
LFQSTRSATCLVIGGSRRHGAGRPQAQVAMTCVAPPSLQLDFSHAVQMVDALSAGDALGAGASAQVASTGDQCNACLAYRGVSRQSNLTLQISVSPGSTYSSGLGVNHLDPGSGIAEIALQRGTETDLVFSLVDSRSGAVVPADDTAITPRFRSWASSAKIHRRLSPRRSASALRRRRHCSARTQSSPCRHSRGRGSSCMLCMQ